MHKQSGYIILITVLVIGAVGVAIAVGLLVLNGSTLQADQTQLDLYQAQAITSACGEQALLKLKQDENYTGGENLVFSEGSCLIGSIIPNGEIYTIHITGQAGEAVRKLEIVVDRHTPDSGPVVMQLQSWRMVADF